ncbi:MAG: TatD family hydrolase [Planctomycetales bacterium]|nr:TatD family hydrolase [Planctomycetales bacterium]
MEFFDTHAHLDQGEFDEDRDDVIARAQAAGVTNIVAVGVTATSSRACVDLASRYEGVYAAVGIQPNYTGEVAVDDWDAIVALARAGDAAERGIVAIGETGLDRYWDHAPWDVQQDYFDRHVRLSQETGLPFIVHLRDCEADILAMLRDARCRGPLVGIMHSYTGTAAGAAESVELGLYVSFAGMVTFKKSDELRRVAATIPDDRILIETDAPYLAPHPRRGRRNEPALVEHTAECLAELRGMTLEDFAAQTTRNAKRLFRLGN